MNPQQLTDNYFESPDGKVMYLKMQGVVFVLFKSPTCHYCTEAMNSFQQLARTENKLKFAIVDVSKYRNIIRTAINSTTPIKNVPTLIFYVNGRPQANYKGPRDVMSIKQFLNKIFTDLQMQPQQGQPPQHRSQSQVHMPKFEDTFQPKVQPNTLSNQTNQEEGLIMPKSVVPHNEPYLARFSKN